MGRIRRVAVVGGGYVGRGFAIQLAHGGREVCLYNRTRESSDRAMHGIKSYLASFVRNRFFKRKEANETLLRIKPTLSFEDAASNANFVIECGPEDLSLKQEIFARLDRLCPPQSVISSATSHLKLDDIGNKTKRKDKLIIIHPYTPVPLRPVVEIVRGASTSQQTFLITKRLLESVGKEVVDVKEQLGVRMTTAIRREAMYIVEKGIASPEEVDRVLCGIGILPVFSGMDASGLDVFLSIHGYLQKELDNRDYPSPLLRERVARGELGMKSGKGFYEWDEASAKEASEKRVKALILRLREREVLGG